jgi:hypothetical protein
MINKEVMSLWKARISMKIRDEHCKMCGQREASLHIFFECFLANYCWWTYPEALSWTLTPINLQQILTFSRRKGERFPIKR